MFDPTVTIGGHYLETAFGKGMCGQHPQFPAAHRSSHTTQGSKLRKAAHWREVLPCLRLTALPGKGMASLVWGMGEQHVGISLAQSTPDQAANRVLVLDLTSFR